MDIKVRNTRFDNLVNYGTRALSNSSSPNVAHHTSADPNALSSLLKHSPHVEFTFVNTSEKIIVHVDKQ
jgi:hypothetical protein